MTQVSDTQEGGAQPSRMRFLFLIPVALFLALAIAFAVGLTRDPNIIPTVFIDKPVPALDLPPAAGRAEGLAREDMMGHVSLLNVFASWCGPCRIEHPLLNAVHESGLVPVYGLNWKDRTEDARRWLDELGDPYTRIGADFQGRAAIDWGVTGAPETFVIDKQGVIRYKQVGPITDAVWRDEMLPLIERLKAE